MDSDDEQALYEALAEIEMEDREEELAKAAKAQADAVQATV